MKFSKYSILFLLALLPQLLFKEYFLTLISTIIIGAIAGWFINEKRVFLKMLLVQFIFFSILFIVKRSSIFYLDQVMDNLELPYFLMPLFFIVFNSLNIAILFYFGYKLCKLIFRRMGTLEPQV